MKVSKLNLNLEAVFLIIFVAVFLWFGIGTLFDHKISHDFPYGYLASDAFLHQTTAQAIKEQGDYKLHPSYAVGGAKDVIGMNPPLLNHLAAVLSYLTGIEVYDVIYFLVYIFALFAILVLYLIIRKYNKNIALLAIPLTLLILSKKFYSGITWGQWDFYPGTLFLLGTVWVITNSDLKNSFFLLSGLLAAALMVHPPDFIWAIGFIGFYLLIRLVLRRFDLKEAVKIGLATIGSVIISFYFFVIFLFVWYPERKTELFKISLGLPNPGYPVVSLTEFGIILYVILMGVAISILLLVKLFNRLEKKQTVLISSVYFLIAGFLVYIGFDKALQLRFNWPIFLALFFGITVFYVTSLIKKYRPIVSFIVALLFLAYFATAYIDKISTQGIMDPYHWQQLMWIKDNADKDAKIFYVYGDMFYQSALLYNSERVSYIVEPNSYAEALNNQTINRFYRAYTASHSSGSYPYRISFTQFGHHALEPEYKKSDNRDICTFDYYVIDIIPQASRQPALIQYNQAIGEQL